MISRADGQKLPNLREESNIFEQAYNAHLTTIHGENLSLQQFTAKNPTLLVLIFTRCTGICYPYLSQLKKQIDLLKQSDNQPFSVLVVSFDPRDSLEDMLAFAQGYGLDDSQNWQFALTDSIAPLIRSLGFEALWNEELGQFDHDALLIGLNEQAYITQKLIGIRSSKEIGELVQSIHNVFSPSYRLPNPNMLFSCFNYDIETGRNKPGLGLIFIALPSLLSFFLLLTIWLMAKRKRMQKKNQDNAYEA